METRVSKYDQQAADFISRFGLSVSIEPHSVQIKPDWMGDVEYQENLRRSQAAIDRIWPRRKAIGHGVRYVVTISREDTKYKPLAFDFLGSLNDAKKREKPTAYDVLACAGSDICCPRSFSEFCCEYGCDEDSRKAYATFEKCNEHTAKLQAFFTTEEQEALSQIQ